MSALDRRKRVRQLYVRQQMDEALQEHGYTERLRNELLAVLVPVATALTQAAFQAGTKHEREKKK